MRGQVVAALDGSGLPGAAVTLRTAWSDESVHAVSDGDGRFVFHGVVPGAYIMSVSSEGFGTFAARVVVEPREVKTVRAALELERIDLTAPPGRASPSLGADRRRECDQPGLSRG